MNSSRSYANAISEERINAAPAGKQYPTGIHPDTLFAGEGFGSLDSESLGKAHQTPAGLTKGSRLPGIISHISELKARIGRQIVVSKGPDGSSHAELIV